MRSFRYKQQAFQQHAVASVVDCFRGIDLSMHAGTNKSPLFGVSSQANMNKSISSEPFISAFSPLIEKNIHKVQKRQGIKCESTLTGSYLTLDTQMETGTGKTFTFINTIFELNRLYGLTHFVIIVPSIAIKEGIKKSFQTTESWFEKLYNKRINLHDISTNANRKSRKSAPSSVINFIYSHTLSVLIMTNHSFNRESNIINQEIEGFFSDFASTPMSAIAKKNPVLIIDEPQIVEGEKTISQIQKFQPLFVLRYSATFRKDQIRNLIYVLDSFDAFSQKLVKGITVTDYATTSADSAFLGVQRIITSSGKLLAELVVTNKRGTPILITVRVGGNPNEIFQKSKNPTYQNLFVLRIDRENSQVMFSNNSIIGVGEYHGGKAQNEQIISEVMLRDTIKRHFEKEMILFSKGIKCISLIFVDRVKDYRDYEVKDEKGYLQSLFEQCYSECLEEFLSTHLLQNYRRYLQRWKPDEVHGGYFSGDRKRNREIDSTGKIREDSRGREIQQEVTELILRDKEKILALENELRFIFAHSALREGWDNPNIFQICKLRSGFSEISLVQEVGRGLRICVNQELERQDNDSLGNEFHVTNSLDIFTLGNGNFIERLQKDLNDRRSQMREDCLYISSEILRETFNIKPTAAAKLLIDLHCEGFVDEDGRMTQKKGIDEYIQAYGLDPKKLKIVRSSDMPDISDSRQKIEAPRTYRVSNSHYKKFKQLWNILHQNVFYRVEYSGDLDRKIIDAINSLKSFGSIHLAKTTSVLSTENGGGGGELGEFTSSEKQQSLSPFVLKSNFSTKVFLRRLVEETNLSRNNIIRILTEINHEKFISAKENPFIAIEKFASVINSVVYQNIVDNIRYVKVDGTRKSKTEITLTDREFSALHYIDLEKLPDYKKNNLWAPIAPYDSKDPEKIITENALADSRITVFAKLPRAINIPAPMHPKGINPDFAIVCQTDGGSELFFVAEAKPTTNLDELRNNEKYRVKFMEKYFEGIDEKIEFLVLKNYQQLLQIIERGAK